MGGRARGPGPRSLELLEWLERLDVAGIEPLGRALRLGRSATYSHVDRLRRAGLLERIYDREGSVVAITRAGRRELGADRRDVLVGATRGIGLRHSRAVSWVAALLSLRERAWVSDHEARVTTEWQVPVIWPGSRGSHRPDLGAVVQTRRIAVEVELSHKAPRRLRAILAGFEDAIASGSLSGGVLYVSDRGDVLDAVRRAAARVGLTDRHFKAQHLDAIQTMVRRLSPYWPMDVPQVDHADPRVNRYGGRGSIAWHYSGRAVSSSRQEATAPTETVRETGGANGDGR